MLSSSPEKLELQQDYDIIFTDAVVEHLITPEHVVHELCRHLRKNGLLILLIDLAGESETMPIHRNIDIQSVHKNIKQDHLANAYSEYTFCSVWRKI
jgi:2-polyprenyl-3-methyl-5-hydroxy-6-metoxy-1,4-benzoquinol methylase